MPIARSCNTEANMEAWYPPGHGDFYESFCNSGLLDTFINQVGSTVYLSSNMENEPNRSFSREENTSSFQTLTTWVPLSI